MVYVTDGVTGYMMIGGHDFTKGWRTYKDGSRVGDFGGAFTSAPSCERESDTCVGRGEDGTALPLFGDEIERHYYDTVIARHPAAAPHRWQETGRNSLAFLLQGAKCAWKGDQNRLYVRK